MDTLMDAHSQTNFNPSGSRSNLLISNVSNQGKSFADIVAGNLNSSPFHTMSTHSNCFKSNERKNPAATGGVDSSSTENSNGKSSDNVPISSDMSASDFGFLTEQLNLMIDAMFKATTMTEAVQVSVKFTNQIVTGLRFSNEYNKNNLKLECSFFEW